MYRPETTCSAAALTCGRACRPCRPSDLRDMCRNRRDHGGAGRGDRHLHQDTAPVRPAAGRQPGPSPSHGRHVDRARGGALDGAARRPPRRPTDPVGRTLAASAPRSRSAVRRFVAEQAVQLHGAMGVTDELDIGAYFKRVVALDALFGRSDYHLRRHAALGGGAQTEGEDRWICPSARTSATSRVKFAPLSLPALTADMRRATRSRRGCLPTPISPCAGTACCTKGVGGAGLAGEYGGPGWTAAQR